MKEVILENEKFKITINNHGAELRSIKKKDIDREYLWNADSRFWGRSSPVLFPFVGGVRNQVYRYQGKEYPMSQHGFARDKDFAVTNQTRNEVWFGLSSDEETYQVYPFRFYLEIGYRLRENEVTVMWKVKNVDEKEMYFSIGAHPAFFCPIREEESQSSYYLGFQKQNSIVPVSFTNTVFGQGGLVTADKKEYLLEEGVLPITEHLFDGDALVIEDHQVQRVALLDTNKEEYLAVEFDSPLVGIWSPPKKHAPFICIEPWYGRCDKEGFDGELEDREWGNVLQPGQKFEADYRIKIL